MSDSVAEPGVVKPAINWREVLPVLLLIGAFIGLYFNIINQIISNIRTSEGSHGLLILGVIGYLVWLKKNDLATLERKPALVSGTLITLAGCLTLFAATLTNTMMLQQLSIIPSLLGLILLVYGYSFFKAFFIPVCYLVFLTGFVDMLLWSQAIHFQQVSAEIAVFLLKLTGMPVLYSNLIIDLPHISLEVARACSGISHIVSLMALSVPLAIMSQLTPFRKCVLVVASFFIGFFANGVRIALIGIYALYNEGADLHGPNETLYVTFIFFFGMVLLIVLSHFLGKTQARSSVKLSEEEAAASEIEVHTVATDAATISSGNIRKRFVAVSLAVLFLLMTLGFVHFYRIEPQPLMLAFDHFPQTIRNFQSEEWTNIDDQVRPFPMEEELMRRFAAPSGDNFIVYVGYTPMQHKQSKVIDARRGDLHQGATNVPVIFSGETVLFNKNRLEEPSPPSDVYFWYVMDNRIITSQYVGKLYTFWNGLTKRRTNGAVVVVQTRSSQEEVMPFLEELVPEVMGFIGGGK